jgi:alpha-beta hydrolase superfamily lysophospholipase
VRPIDLRAFVRARTPRGSVLHYLEFLPADYASAVRTHARSLFGTASVPARYREGDLAPVLLLPGVYESWRTLRWFADYLNEQGHPVVVIPGMGHNVRPVAATAEMAQRVVDVNDLHGVILLAHSKGGLVGKTMMLDTDTSARIDRMVAVNSPFSGSRMARFIPGKTLRAFRTDDVGLVRLSGLVDANARITSVFARFDGHVPDGSHLEGARNVSVPVDGHFRILGHPAGRAAILAALQS